MQIVLSSTLWLNKTLESNLTLAETQKLTMWPAGLPRALPFFAMVAQTPDYLLLKSTTQCVQSEGATEQEVLHPDLMHKGRKIHHFRPYCHFLPEREVLPWQQPTKEEVRLLWSNSSQPVLRNASLSGDRDEPNAQLIVPQSLQGQRLQLFKPRSRNLSVVDSILLEALVKPTQVMSLKQQNTSIVLKALIPPHISLIRKVKSVNVSVLWD